MGRGFKRVGAKRSPLEGHLRVGKAQLILSGAMSPKGSLQLQRRVESVSVLGAGLRGSTCVHLGAGVWGT